MAQKLEFEVNNQQKLVFEQDHFNGHVHVCTVKPNGDETYGVYISAGDMVMLFNYYIHAKKNHIIDNFINIV